MCLEPPGIMPANREIIYQRMKENHICNIRNSNVHFAHEAPTNVRIFTITFSEPSFWYAMIENINTFDMWNSIRTQFKTVHFLNTTFHLTTLRHELRWLAQKYPNTSITDLLEFYQPSRTPVCTCTQGTSPPVGDRAFYIVAPYLWNDLPCNMRKRDPIHQLKDTLKLTYSKELFNHEL